MRLNSLFIVAIMVIFVSSCKSKQKLSELVYFNQRTDTTLSKRVMESEPVIQVGDRLSIQVTALDPASVAPYNFNSSAANSTGIPSGGYVVETDGTISYPQLGRLKVEGLKRKQLIDTLTSRISRFVVEPVVAVQYLNFKITVLGEVGRQGTINIPDAKVTLLEAIGLAGDLTLYSRRDNILVIREQNGVREFGRVNLLSTAAFNSPYFVLKQNDVVYVELTQLKVANSDVSLARNIGIGASIISVISALTALIINIVK